MVGSYLWWRQRKVLYSHLNSSYRLAVAGLLAVRDGEERLNDSLVDELHMSAGIQRAIDRSTPPRAAGHVRECDDFCTQHTRALSRGWRHRRQNTHMRLDELDGESGLADTCAISKGTKDERRPRAPSNGRRVRRMGAAASRGAQELAAQ